MVLFPVFNLITLTMKKIIASLFCIGIALLSHAQNKESVTKFVLSDGWNMQSSLEVKAKGSEVSNAGYKTSGWYNIKVPSTIIAGLIENNEFDFDPLYGQNLKKIKGKRFDNHWWFRKEFQLPATEKGKTVVINLHGINYRADVWINGTKVATEKEIIGPFRTFELDVTEHINFKGTNVLAIELIRPFNTNKKDGDLAIDYADWIPYPADFNGGIINDVVVKTFNGIEIKHPLVTTKFDLPSLEVAHLDVDAEVKNYTNKAAEVVVKGVINSSISFEKTVTLQANETKKVTFSSDEFTQLNIKDPKIWWPWQYGTQEMNNLEMEVVHKNITSDMLTDQFGIRQITSEMINDNSRVFMVNGKKIMLRGAAWSPDIFLRRSRDVQETHIKLARDMNLNVIRTEGKFEDDNFYELCDQYGILVFAGWMCCGTWEYPENWNAEERHVAMESERSMMYWLRNKASLMVWANGSDFPPTVKSVEEDWLAIQKELKWPNPIVGTTDETFSEVSGVSGLKMNGPYEWVPPIYWETDTQYGGAWSFATEISPGVSMPPYESLIKFLPEESIKPGTDDWLYHCGTMEFANTDIFDEALNNRYGKSDDIKEYLAKAQVQNYEAHRAMMEAYGFNKYEKSTGIIQWMMNNPWPGLIWHTYDYYYYPAGTYFGVKKSLELLHIQYSYKSKEVIVTNSLLEEFNGLTAKAQLYNINGELKHTQSEKVNIGPDGVIRAFTIPEVEGLSSTWFVRLELTNSKGEVESVNWYWLSDKDDTIDFNTWTFYYCPQVEYTDYSELQNLPLTTLATEQSTKETKNQITHTIKITNTGSAVAFFTHVRALDKKGGDDILPVSFSDNYLLLAPGESRTIECSYETDKGQTKKPFFEVSMWNIDTSNSTSKNNNFEFKKEY